MAYFLAGVGNAEILKKNRDGVEELFATAKTLTDSSITIGVSAEDIRAGQGAKLYGKYFHTSTFDLKMTDAMFKMEYIAANVGAELEWGGDVFKDEQVKADADGKITITGAKPFTSGSTVYVYAKLPEDEFYKTYTVAELSAGVEAFKAKDVCVKYLYTNDNARKLTVKANFTPDTLSVLLTSNLYAGDDKNPATGTKVGTVTIKVPRFLLSGSQELSMNMTGASTTPFEGSALASNAEGCDGEGIYAEIIEIIEGRKWIDNIKELLVENEEDLQSGDYVNVYAVTYDGAIKKLKWGRQTEGGYVLWTSTTDFINDSTGNVEYYNAENPSYFEGENFYSEKIYFSNEYEGAWYIDKIVNIYIKSK